MSGVVRHGAKSGILTDRLDMRTVAGKALGAYRAALTAHIGGEPTVPEAELIDQASRLALLCRIAWVELDDKGATTKRGVSPAFDAYVRAARDQRAVFELLGLERRRRELPSLSDVLNEACA